MKKILLWCACGVLTMFLPSTVLADVHPGRHLTEGRTFTIALSAGNVNMLDASVQETNRAYDGTDRSEYEQYLENYTLGDFGVDTPYTIYGLSMEKQWRYVTLAIDASYLDIETTATARRIYAIGADVDYAGKSYDHMLIPEGQEFKTSLDTSILSAKLLITPCYVANESESVSFSPWVHLGIFGMGGKYTIDAGPAQGTTTYEAYPYTYVIGGKGESWNGLAVPEIGIGGAFKFKLGERLGAPVNLVLSGDYSILEFEGSSEDIGFRSRHEKDLDIDYAVYEFGAKLEWPLTEGMALVIGLQYRRLTADASSKAKVRDIESQQELLEKYDKDINLDIGYYNLLLGLQF
jgi:hypothetical protein